MVQLSPYLNFNGKGSEAMKFYQSIFGGELKVQTFGETGQAKNDAEKDLLLHGELHAEGITFYASDGHEDQHVTMGDSVHMSLSGDDEERVGHEFRDGTSCTQNVLGFPTSLDLAGIAGDTLGCRRTPWRRCPGWD